MLLHVVVIHGSGKILMANSSRLSSEIKSALLISTGGEPSDVEQASMEYSRTRGRHVFGFDSRLLNGRFSVGTAPAAKDFCFASVFCIRN